jgi:hypothetical protein
VDRETPDAVGLTPSLIDRLCTLVIIGVRRDSEFVDGVQEEGKASAMGAGAI